MCPIVHDQHPVKKTHQNSISYHVEVDEMGFRLVRFIDDIYYNVRALLNGDFMSFYLFVFVCFPI